jgi:nitroimidazol reductase NimA-like FMN-containing flavoprotein (pyridoxamine 5'-phosphate oxidase superfamily)
MAYRASYDPNVLHSILDSAYVCHIAFIDAGEPQVIPMSYWRNGEFVYFHSSVQGRFARVCREAPVAVCVTVMDGLVLGHSPINHSINYRSVVIHGRPEAIEDRSAKASAMRSFFDKTIPGRWDDLRAVRDDELDALTVFRLRLDQASAKIRNDFPDTEDHMARAPVWTGTVPLQRVFLPPVADPRFDVQPTPPYLASFVGKPDFSSRVDRS